MITLSGAASVSIEQNSSYVDAGASATDNVDSSVEVSASGVVDTSIIDEYTITFTATDNAGNSRTLDRLLNVAIEDSVAAEFESSQMEIDYLRVYAPGAGSNASPVWSDEFD